MATPVHAGILDWFNGASTGTDLPAHDGRLVSGLAPLNPKLTLIDFWATWCAPCRNNVPHLNAIAERYGPRGLSVLALSMESVETVTPHLAAWGMKYAVLAGGSRPLQASLSIRALPYTVLVDKSNKIAWRGQPAELTDALLESHLAKAA
jgi:thiol-disulfide isomerase/thioredoxin